MPRLILSICSILTFFLLAAPSRVLASEITRFDEGPFAGMGYPFSESARTGGLLFLAGQIGEDADGNLVPGGIQAEAEQVMLNISAALERRGLTLENVVKCTVFLADVAEWGAFNEVYVRHFSPPYPARSAMGASGLAGNARVEVECIAGYPEDAAAATGVPAAAAGHQAGEEAAILAVMDAYMHEISANDLAAMDARQTAEGMTYRIVSREDDGWDVVPRPNSYWVAPERADEHTYHERYWSPTVMVRGAMAQVWAPYEFQVDGETSHCGVDVFSFARIGGAWKVTNSMWTVEPDACAELRPADSRTIRPVD